MKGFFRFPWLIVLVMSAITVFFAIQIPKAELDNNTFRFVPEDSPARLAMKEVDATFGSQMFILVGFKRTHGTVLEKEFLLQLREFCNKAEEITLVGDVTSLVSSDYISGSDDTIKVEPLVADNFAATDAELAQLKDKLLEWELYSRALVSDDFQSTQVLVPLDIDQKDAGAANTIKSYNDLNELANSIGFKGTTIHLTGMPAFSAVMNNAMRADLRVLIPLVVLIVLGVLFLSFRRVGGIVLPMMTVVVSTIWALGAMSFLGFKMSMLATILPVILVAIGSAYGIHIISHYYDELAGIKKLTMAEHRDMVLRVLGLIGRPVLLAALTTFAGFVSLCFTTVIPIQEFGIFASFGVLVALLVSVTVIPALLIIRGPGKSKLLAAGEKKAGEVEHEDVLDDAHLEADFVSRSIANGFGRIARGPRAVVVVGIVVVLLCFFGSARIVIDNVIIEYFKPDTDIAKSDVFIREEFGGSKSLSVVVRSETKGDVLDPEVLKSMDDLDLYLSKNIPEVGKVSGFHQLVKRMNQVFNADEPASGVVAQTNAAPAATTSSGLGDFGFGFDNPAPAPVVSKVLPKAAAPKAQALDPLALAKLMSQAYAAGSGNSMTAEELVKELYRQVNYRGAAYYEIPYVPAKYAKVSSEELKGLISNYLFLLSGDLKAWADDALEPKAIRMNVQIRTVGQTDTDRVVRAIEEFSKTRFPKTVKVEVSGVVIVEKQLNEMVVSSQLASVFSSLLMVFIILAVYYRSMVAGLLGIIPLSISIAINFAVMGLTGIKLNIGTAMVASISVGVGIDYIIHYMSGYHHEYLRGTAVARLLRRTFLTSGKAILYNGLAVGAGFAVLLLSQFNMLVYLGTLIALTMFVSAFVSLTVLPALLILLKPKFIQRALPFEKAQIVKEKTA